jgi:hypothetical protein
MMALVARLYRSHPDERRDAKRHASELDATVRTANGAPSDVLIHDLSTTGFRMETREELQEDSIVWLGIVGAGINGATVTRRDAGGYGCRFLVPITGTQLAATLSPVSTVIAAPWNQREADAADIPEVKKLPHRMRLAIIVFGSLALWAALILGLLHFLH